jgi:hypothetical protein
MTDTEILEAVEDLNFKVFLGKVLPENTFWVTQGKQTWKRKRFNKRKLGNLAFYLFKHKEDAELHAITLSKDWMKWDKKPAKPISWDGAVRIAEYLNCDVIQILEFTAGNWEYKLVYI